MATIEVNSISKAFGKTQAVQDVSFSVNSGEIFGLLGPNGAGKTTSIRIILDIFRPDSGTVQILGGEMTEEKKNHIGYLPEERGLYQEIKLDQCLVYLATLKGLPTAEARKRVDSYIERFELGASRKKKVKELSKGMQQKAQLIATLIHEPQVVIIDEPFTALDPVNTQMVKEILRQERDRGTTIIMSTHQMHQVEEMCDRLVLINHGHSVLYGELADIRRQFSGRDLLVSSPQALPDSIPGVSEIQPHNGALKLCLTESASPQDVLKYLVQQDIPLEQFEIAVPTLDEIFIRVVQQEGAQPNG